MAEKLPVIIDNRGDALVTGAPMPLLTDLCAEASQT